MRSRTRWQHLPAYPQTMTAHEADAGALRDHYRDLTPISRRAEGFRYAAALPDDALVQVVAINPQVAQRVVLPERFLAALEKASCVHHECLGRPLAFGRAGDGMLHCAFARVESMPLEPGKLGAGQVAAIGVRLARGLSGAHEAGLVHGAVTTERIVRTGDQRAHLDHFGLFSALNQGGLGVREAATLLSDPAFLSPEVESGEEPDARSDVYSLGAALYELLTGKPPYGGRTTSFVVATLLSDSNEQPGAAADRSRPIVDALLRAIERSPDDRWPSAAAFAKALGVASTGPASSTANKSWLEAVKRLFK
jgi:serine/threonine protein kinase